MRMSQAPLLAAAAALSLAVASPMAAQLVLFETAGITLGDDAVECSDQGSYRACESDAGTERVLSHDGLVPADRIPLDFHLYLPPVPASGPDGNYPLVVFIHGWGGSRTSIGGGVEAQMVPYAESGYAVLAYSARAWGNSCGSFQTFNPECQGQWNHLADIRYEVRDTQYFAGLLADELSDDGTPLIDPLRIGVTGVSYGGGQSTMLATLKTRVVDLGPGGTTSAWLSPQGKAMQIAAAAPYWPWTDLAYSLAPNGRTLDYVVDAPYRGPGGTNPLGISKNSYINGLYALGVAFSKFAPPGGDPDVNTWKVLIDAGEPYTEPTVGSIVDAITGFRSGYYWIDPAVEPAPILFNQGWSDDLFPVNEPVRYINRVRDVFGPGVRAKLVASDYGHDRAGGADAAHAQAAARAWLDYWLMGIGEEPGPNVRVRTQSCGASTPAVDYEAATWNTLSPGELRLQDAAGGTVLSSGGPSEESRTTFDPIAGAQSGFDACSRAQDTLVAGTVVYDFPAAGVGGYTVLGSPTVIADMSVTGTAENAILAARLLDVDASGAEQLLARGVYRPDAAGQQVFQLSPIGFLIEEGHHLQLELMGQEPPTFRPSNLAHSIALTNVDLRIPVAEAPDGGQILPPEPEVVPAGYLPEPGALASLLAGVACIATLRRRRR